MSMKSDEELIELIKKAPAPTDVPRWVREHIKKAYTIMGEGMELRPVAFLLAHDAEGDKVGIFPLDAAPKDMWEPAMSKALDRMKSDEYVFVSSAFAYAKDLKGMSEEEKAELESGHAKVRPSEHPDRFNIAFVLYGKRNGENRGWMMRYDLDEEERVINLPKKWDEMEHQHLTNYMFHDVWQPMDVDGFSLGYVDGETVQKMMAERTVTP